MKLIPNNKGEMKISLKETHPAWEEFQKFLNNLPQVVKEQLVGAEGLSNALWLGYKEGWEDAVSFMEHRILIWTED